MTTTDATITKVSAIPVIIDFLIVLHLPKFLETLLFFFRRAKLLILDFVEGLI